MRRRMGMRGGVWVCAWRMAYAQAYGVCAWVGVGVWRRRRRMGRRRGHG